MRSFLISLSPKLHCTLIAIPPENIRSVRQEGREKGTNLGETLASRLLKKRTKLRLNTKNKKASVRSKKQKCQVTPGLMTAYLWAIVHIFIQNSNPRSRKRNLQELNIATKLAERINANES